MVRLLICLFLKALLIVPYYGFSASVKKAAEFLGIPYREDGARNQWGQYTTFNNPGAIYHDAGYNCSGFLVSVARAVLSKEISLEQARRDRKGDSGPGAPLGQDWDFGLDLILNLTDGLERKPLRPDPRRHISAGTAPEGKPKGFSIHDLKIWQQVLPLLKQEFVYFVAINKPYRKRGYRLIYYHVAMIIPENPEKLWFYHTTRKIGSHRLNLASAEGMSLLQREFARSPYGDKHIYILEVAPPSG